MIVKNGIFKDETYEKVFRAFVEVDCINGEVYYYVNVLYHTMYFGVDCGVIRAMNNQDAALALRDQIRSGLHSKLDEMVV